MQPNKNYIKQNQLLTGFTLIELIIVIAITAILASIVLLTVQQYLNKGKDANISGNLAVLIPAGEAWYNGNGNSYEYFCNPNPVDSNPGNSALKNAIYQMPYNLDSSCYGDPGASNWTTTTGGGRNPAGLCCYVDSTYNDAWVACVPKFSDKTMALCVDSRGVKKDITKSQCDNLMSENPLQCPD